MKTHIIQNGVVVNTILATVSEAQAAYPDATCVDATVGGIGWTWDDNVLSPPPAPTPTIPASVTMRQARLALLRTGNLAAIAATIGALPSPQKEAAQIEWEYSQEVQRHNGFVSQIAPLIGLNDQAVDELFITASKL